MAVRTQNYKIRFHSVWVFIAVSLHLRPFFLSVILSFFPSLLVYFLFFCLLFAYLLPSQLCFYRSVFTSICFYFFISLFKRCSILGSSKQH